MRCDWHEETDRISPHYTHIIQTWGDGNWTCVDCEGLKCDRCREYDVANEGDKCGECISEEAEYFSDYYLDEGGNG